VEFHCKALANGLSNSQHCWTKKVGSCRFRVGSGVKTDASIPTNNMQQGLQTEATCGIQQCCVCLHGAQEDKKNAGSALQAKLKRG